MIIWLLFQGGQPSIDGPDQAFGIFSKINTSGASVTSAIVDAGQGVLSSISEAQGVFSGINTAGVGVFSTINSGGQGVESII